MVKGMGFNAISVYIMWNFHELEKGKFDYENGDKNLRGFMELAKQHGLMVLFRPGPYVCAEWDFGGLPARLLSVKGLEIRANNKLFLDEVKVYFASLMPIINDYSITKGGPIIMLQI
jgi:beta-galactosidase